MQSSRTPAATHGFQLAIVVALVVGCAGDGSSIRSGVTVRDSAGVRIVTSTAPVLQPGEEWRVAGEPAVSIGLMQGDEVYQFHGIRGIDLLPDGGLVVLDGGSAQLRRFDAGGALVWSAGSRGEGPGEFEQPSYLGRTADGAFALWDRNNGRLTLIDADGQLVSTRSYLHAEGATPIAYGIFADGSLLATFPHSITPPPPGTVLADTIRLWHVSDDPADRRLLARFPGPRWIWTGRFQIPVPFSANPLRATDGERVFAAGGTAHEIRVIDPAGQRSAVYRLQRDAIAVEAADVRRTVDHWIEHRFYGAPAAVWNEWLERMPVPDRRPAFDRLVVSDTGHVWVRRFLPEADTDAVPVWDVFASDGAWLGVIETPKGFEIYAIDDGRIAGVFRDTLDVEFVRVYPVATERAAASAME